VRNWLETFWDLLSGLEGSHVLLGDRERIMGTETGHTSLRPWSVSFATVSPWAKNIMK